MKPKVMCFSGLDPSGIAGLQADRETLFSLGCHSIPIPALLTAQDTKDVCYLQITEPNFLELQSRTINDTCIDCFKIGVLRSVKTIETLHSILKNYPNTPIVLEPGLSAGGNMLAVVNAALGSNNISDNIQSLTRLFQSTERS
jgi:hydroxymethylpyrimidine/phosphomethylpyrimidine kinase